MKAMSTAWMLLALTWPTLAGAQSYVPIERRVDAAQLAEVGLTPAQLVALNRLLREADGKAGAVTVAAVPAAPLEETEGPPASLGDAPIKSRVTGAVAGWEPGTVFELDNGQQWKVLKGSMRLRQPLQSPDIVVVPGVAGRWFLQVDPDLPKARVYRVD